eukprot:GFYU01002507.1.p1 GENE.GFYU01002507.1~~GFYU01002507.1.p1  ORF type:complete len:678 (-),score=232.94 GFYU01002507.1:318-2351(-)
MTAIPTDGTAVIQDDPWLEPQREALRHRMDRYRHLKHRIEEAEGSVEQFSKGYEKMGFNQKEGGLEYREWAPGAEEAFLFGDFNNWDRRSHAMTRDKYGVFSIFLPNHHNGALAIPHNSKVKIILKRGNEEWDRIPAWITRAVPEETTVAYVGIFWSPLQPYVFKNERPQGKKGGLRIYEAHVGISSPEAKITSYKEFAQNLIPRIADAGYNCIQLMAIMEHAYYASFGYHVTNFFASSSRFGTPEDLKELVDTAHAHGVYVIMDVVHSHASNNVLDGLNQFDGTDHQYFHDGPKGRHELWDSRTFNYGHWEVLRFLLSNLRYYLEEFRFDGFRFDGVTSMMYHHHGIGTAFSGNYADYFNESVDNEALAYLMLANDMCHTMPYNVITIAEDVSGMPTLCRPVAEGGVGFDYRMGMAIPDKWIELVKETKDEEWSMGDISHTLSNRRYKEGTVAYAECHDQALVGDKTLAFWLMDKEMYDFMSVMSPLTPIIDRGLALHKMLRLITLGLGGEAYLNFIGNEFGHPEWIDFPREGNGNSYHHARRRFDLADDDLLRYKLLNAFDKQMLHLEANNPFLESPGGHISRKHEEDKVIVFHRANLLFVFNFHPTRSFEHYRVACPYGGKYKIVLDTDWGDFGGHNRNDPNTEFHVTDEPWDDQQHFIQIYVPSRVGLVFRLE